MSTDYTNMNWWDKRYPLTHNVNDVKNKYDKHIAVLTKQLEITIATIIRKCSDEMYKKGLITIKSAPFMVVDNDNKEQNLRICKSIIIQINRFLKNNYPLDDIHYHVSLICTPKLTFFLKRNTKEENISITISIVPRKITRRKNKTSEHV